jgi:short-subunit dehydrogenase
MNNKIAVVTGGTKGIGLSIVKKFLEYGFEVHTCGSSQKSVDDLNSTYPNPNLFVSQVDLRKREEIEIWANRIKTGINHVSVLVNNAGRFLPGSIGEEEENTFEELMAINLGSAYHTTRAFLPGFKSNLSGHIFNICSTASITAYVNGGSYCISKFGLLGFSKVLREELKPFNVKVTSILPGATFTDSWSLSGIPESRFMKPEDIAELIWAAYSLSENCVVEEILLRPILGDIV